MPVLLLIFFISFASEASATASCDECFINYQKCRGAAIGEIKKKPEPQLRRPVDTHEEQKANKKNKIDLREYKILENSQLTGKTIGNPKLDICDDKYKECKSQNQCNEFNE